MALVASGGVAGLGAVLLFPPLAATEHGFAFALGVVAGGRIVRAQLA